MVRLLFTQLLSAFVSLAFAAAAQPPRNADSKIESVTLYRDQALVTRTLTLQPGEGVQTVTIGNLPELLVADSVFAEADEHAAIRAVRVSTRQHNQSSREDVRAIEDELKVLREKMELLSAERIVLDQNREKLDQMVSFTSGAAREDLQSGVLDADVLTMLVKFSMATRAELSQLQVKNAQAVNATERALELLTRKLQELSQTDSKLGYDAQIFAEVKANLPSQVRLSYLVSGCGWSPQYTIRGGLKQAKIDIRYSAIIQQMSGEDWSDVQLTLSTASPSVSAAGPVLTPFRVRGADHTLQQAGSDNAGMTSLDAINGALKSLRLEQRSAENRSYGNADSDSPVRRDLTLNSLAGRMQQVELQAEAQAASKLASDADDDVASQVYKLSTTVSLTSRTDQQLVQIADLAMDGEIYHTAIPLLSSYAYREAFILNDWEFGLLAGPATVYLDGRFVGRTLLPTTASRQHFVIGFGADQQVRTRRELQDKQDEVQGGNRRLTFKYRLVVSNFQDTPMKIRLLDRMPISDQKQQVSIALTEPTPAISEDALYQRIQRGLGILRWDLTVPAGANGSEAYDLDYQYTLEFDRNRELTAVDTDQQMQQDYFQLQAPSPMMGK